MSPKQHGSTAAPVQAALRWGVDHEVADFVCCYNRDGAEPSLAFTRYESFTEELSSGEPVVFYDSVSGSPLFVAPQGRTMDEFIDESRRHGWPSFRLEEVVWEHVRVLEGSEVVSTAGTHLGHLLGDARGPRLCINLCSVAGVDPRSSAGLGVLPAAEGGASGRLRAAWPLLHELAAVGQWRGQMHYASGEEGMTPAPNVVLAGEMHVQIRDGQCLLTSSVVFPGGAERVVRMAGELQCEAGSTARLEKEGGGPISLLLSEHAAARQILMRELNATTGDSVLTSSLVLIGGGDDGSDPELLQTSHELTQPGGGVSGVQMWRMSPGGAAPSASPSAAVAEWPVENDEEAFMYSGSQL